MSAREITGGAMMAAAAVVLMAVSVVIPTLSITCAAFSGFIIMFAYLKWGMKTALVSYVTASILGILLLPNKEAAILFAVLYGQYPMIKAAIEQKSGKLRAFALKALYFNADMLLIYYFVSGVLGFQIIEPNMSLSFAFVFMNVIFLIYDYTFSPLMKILRQRFFKFLWR
ncbi:hypothetical protein SDC9_68691 [bioreactor metagenome]|uniref:Uncharacterized protein n=1 Tax=bioreactor metagenome TaxID=1076179 RepID=A0A644Y147_9ZZZZ